MWGSPESAVQRPNGINNGGQGGGGNQSNKYQGKNVVCVGEELKIAVNLALERFRLSEDMQEFDFPSSLKSNERAYVHNLCVKYGFKSRSKGKKSNRILTVMKKDLNSQSCVLTNVDLVRNSRNQIQNLLQKHPLTVKERQELQQRNERNQMNESMMKEIAKTTTGRLNNGMPQVPPPKSTSPEFLAFQDSLPVSKMKDVIVKTINENKVILISGETGSGKTTQIPQLILNDCHANNKACRIFCTQPRRLSALTIAERVAAERGEKIGHTVGYQIRLESRVSPKTILTFCTNGVLLRTLMAGSQTISDVTHILVDEVHERDRFCDFLLTVLKDLLPRMKHLKLVLMSANINTQLFSTYFTGCPILQLAGRMFDVQELFLEDILKWTNYTNKEMEKRQQSFVKSEVTKCNLDEWCSKKFSCNNNSSSSSSSHNNNNNNDVYPSFDYQNPYLNNNSNNNLNKNNSSNNLYTGNQMCTEGIAKLEAGTEREELEPWLVKEWDDLLAEIWLNVKEEIFSQIFHLILNENVNVDHRHSEMSVTPLMVAAGRGFISVVEKLLNMGANVHVRSSNEWRAIDWAQKFDQAEVVELIEAHIATLENSEDDDANLLKFSDSLTKEDKELLSLYHSSFDDDKVDVDLIICLLQKIHSLQQPGAILVFLPGYDEIMTLRERIVESRCFAENARYILYTLHSQMQSSDQKNIFKVPESGTRKIILSTNIAETSITINDVVFVIDSGKVKMKSYDALTSVSMLKTQWISKSSVSQRSGRAGRCRPGVAYHLFSSVRYQHMQEYPLPELVCYPLQELCLHTKLLASPNCKIADFLSKAPEPPAFLITKNAVHLLKQIDALDPFEDLTELGHHLADLPIEPKYGKMILYSVVLKCLDPILTIACSLAYKDPFLLPSLPHQKRAAAMSRRRFAAGTCSDHMALLRAFQSWQKARSEGWEKSFCNKNFLSSSTMEMIVSMRTQLLGQLRAAGFVRARGGGDIRDLNSNSENWSVVKAALCAGMYPNLIKVNKERSHLITNKESKIRFHSSSVLGPAPNEVGSNMHNVAVSRLPTDWLAFEEMTRMHRTLQVKSCTAISPITVALFAGPAKLPSSVIMEAENSVGVLKIESNHNSMQQQQQQQQQPQQIPADSWHSDSEQEDIKDDNQPKSYLALDDWIKFSFEPGNSTLIVQLRLKWHSLFMRRMKAPTKLWSPFDETTIKTIVNVLTNEEHALGLQQPAGIGQRPRPMCSETSVMSGGSKELSSSSSSLSSLPGAAELSNNQDGPSSAAKNYSNDIEDKFMLMKLQQSNSNAATSSTASTNTNQNNSLIDKQQYSSLTLNTSSASNTNKPLSPRHIFYFIVKAANMRLLNVSENKKIWPTSQNFETISKLLKDGKTVYFIYTVHGCNNFQGYARVIQFVVNHNNRDLPNFYYVINWIKKFNVPFHHCQSLLATIFDKKPINFYDCQEIDANIGEQLIKLWHKQQPAITSSSSSSSSSSSNFHLPQNPLFLGPLNQDSIWSSNGRKASTQSNLENNNNNNASNNNNNNNMADSNRINASGNNLTSAANSATGNNASVINNGSSIPLIFNQQFYGSFPNYESQNVQPNLYNQFQNSFSNSFNFTFQDKNDDK